MTAFKGLIFDLDGVIANTADLHFLAWQKIAQAIGGQLSRLQYKKLKGVSRMESLDLILLWNGIGLTPAHKEVLAQKKNQLYLRMIADLKPSDTLPGVLPFIRSARALNLRIALGSASQNAEAVLQALDMTKYFDVIVDGTQTGQSKPSPEVFLHGAQRLALPTTELVVFEDGIRGVEAARAGEFAAVGVGDRDDFPTAHLVIPNFLKQHPEPLLAQLSHLR
jgi:beta-phosphoglucomutase